MNQAQAISTPQATVRPLVILTAVAFIPGQQRQPRQASQRRKPRKEPPRRKKSGSDL